MPIRCCNPLARLVGAIAWVLCIQPALALANDPPSVQLPSPGVTNEDTSVAVPGIIISDLENDALVVFLGSPDGSLSPSFLAGTPAEVTAALASLVFTPSDDYSGSTIIDLTIEDEFNQTPAQLAMSVTALPPQVSLPASTSIGEDVVLEITEFVLQDADGPITVWLGSPDGSVTPGFLSGDAATVASQISLVTFIPNDDFSGPAFIDILIDDGPHSINSQYTLTVTATPPQVSLPASTNIGEDVVLEITEFVLQDADGPITVWLGSPDGSVTPGFLSGDAATVASQISFVTFIPNDDFSGPAFIDILIDDGPHSINSQYTFTVTATPPQVSLPASANIGEDVVLEIIEFVLQDADGPITVWLGSPDGSVSPSFLSGDAATVASQISFVTFIPNDDFSGPAFIDILIDDGPHSINSQYTLTVTATPPQVSLPASTSIGEDMVLEITEFVLQDADGPITVWLGSPDGSVSPSFLSGDAATVASQISLVTFIPNDDFSGPAFIDILIDDGPHSINSQYTFTVTATPPQISAPVEFAGPPDEDLPLAGLSLLDADQFIHVDLVVDAGMVIPETIEGSASAVQDALSQAVYTPPPGFEGEAQLLVHLLDGPHEIESEVSIVIDSALIPMVPGVTPIGSLLTALLIMGVRARHSFSGPAPR